MQLRSGRSTLRRDSRNLDEFAERRRYQKEKVRYQKEQQRIEESIYEDEVVKPSSRRIEYSDEILKDKKLLEKKIASIFHKSRHLLYLNKCQNLNKHSFTQKLETVMELYELYRYNMDYLIHYFNNGTQKDKDLARAIYDKGHNIRVEMFNHRLKRTRSENELYYKCNDLIHFVTYMIYRYVLAQY
jgi:NAD-dependent SIR2 family protein deacetylase